MTKLKRFTGKVFGGSATAVGDDPQIAQFGSALANTFVGTTDPEIIQKLPAWGQGWIGAVTPTQQYPALPEMTGAMKVLSHQICGILQQGVSTWDSGTIYYTGNFCSKNGIVYVSLSDINQGNDPEADTTNWRNYGGANIDLSNLSSQGQNIANWSTNVTNCITEIPQRIKWDLTDGVFTLKAGSVVIVPNGVGVFEDLEISQDLNITLTGTGQSFLFKRVGSITAVDFRPVASAFSGTSDANTKGTTYYNTSTNIVTSYNANGDVQTSLPFAIVTYADGLITSIDQVFNGMGYIGSTIWVDKGVKGLIPNGRNEDGTLRNIEFITDKVLTYTVSGSSSVNLIINKNGYFISNNTFTYDRDDNFNYQNNNKISYCDGGFISIANGVITSFNPKLTFRAVDYNDAKDYLISDKYDGQWVAKSLILAQFVNVDVTSETTNIEYDLSSYLPNDEYNYEVFVNVDVSSAGVVGAYINGLVVGNGTSNQASIANRVVNALSVNNYYMVQSGSAIVPIGKNRKLIFRYNVAGAQASINMIQTAGYRRIGTNE